MKHLNKDHADKKNSTVYTPKCVVSFILKHIIKDIKKDKILDPAIGAGNLTNKLRKDGSYIIGNDIDKKGKKFCDEFYNLDIEKFNVKIKDLDLIIMNPPFNGHPNRKLYPEVFIDKMFELYGKNIPMVAIIPTGYRINQRLKSKRWRKIRDSYNISSIITLPLDVFEGVQFHTEVIIFNIPNLKPHYFLDI